MKDREYCPKCQELRDLRTAIVKKEEEDPEGNMITVVTKSYHCAVCQVFVRSEDEILEAEDEGDETPVNI